jgi:hypothetical protein
MEQGGWDQDDGTAHQEVEAGLKELAATKDGQWGEDKSN